MLQRNFKRFLVFSILLSSFGCQRPIFENRTVAPATLRDLAAIKLNFRFETDAPAPPETNQQAPADEKNAAIQADFDQNRAQEVLEKVVASPDKQRVLAVYRQVQDLPSQFRLDMYAPDGRLVRKITPNGMAVHFPDTIVWSPDSNSVAFVAMIRVNQPSQMPQNVATPPDLSGNASTPPTNADADANANTDSNTNIDANAPTAPTPEAPKNVLTFRTEQIYTCNADGGDLKPLTQNEGLIYFYFVWSPDSAALVSLAATWREWQVGQAQAEQRFEIFTPSGRPRLVEKNGRERRLDDNMTPVQPVWSPDSAKVAVAFDKEVRIYDAIGDAPTQAAIPLRNPLLISSKTFDDELRRKDQEANSNTNVSANANTNANTNANANINANAAANVNANTQPTPTDVNTLPDENLLVSFNPVIELRWTEDKMLYLQTGYVKEMKDAANSARSYLRWHRLLFSPQATALN